MKNLFALIIPLAAVLGACAHQPVKPSYVSPVPYQGWNCAQLHTEYARINQYIQQGVEPATRQHVGVGIGIGGGWGGWGRHGWGISPNISIGMGESAATKRSELADLYGQQDAIAQTAQFKNCPILHPRQTNGTTKTAN